MILRRTLTISLCLLLLSTFLNAQHLEHRPGFVIVQTKPDVDINRVISQYGDLQVDRILSARLGIYLISFDNLKLHEGQILKDLKNDSGIAIAQFDHLTKLRNTPDDARYTDQWHWNNEGQTGGSANSDIDADRAWDITTGGVTSNGDTIVVAIIDDGLQVDHEDIAANVWINYLEIPDNGIDEDGNGYIDDYYGWNAYDNNPQVIDDRHGLQVGGLVGAVGNNGVGVTGMNWNVKLMTIVGGVPESAAIASYAYALEMRILYDETNGEKGAFVVVTNSSWGIDFGQPSESPLWCAFYDTLGEHGILSCGATSNSAYDVDLGGDLPTACPSEYLLSITATDHNDSRNFSAWGKNHIDLAAPGDNVLTTRRNNGYGANSGTSFASPITAGLVALLYSVPCTGLADLAKSDPKAAALIVRDMIFQGVREVPSLESTIRLGGVLNAGNSAELLLAICSECPTPISVSSNVISDVEAEISWSLLSNPDSIRMRIRPEGVLEWDTVGIVTSPYLLTGLTGCTNYEISFESFCADTTTGFGEVTTFRTDGCCELPTNVGASNDNFNIYLIWDEVLAAESYLVQWRPEGNESWNDLTTNTASATISDLDSCSYYEYRLQTNCAGGSTEFSEIDTIRTQGCGACIDLPYCSSNGADATADYIDSLKIGPITNNSGFSEGYAFFDQGYDLIKGDSYSYNIKPGFGFGGSFDEYFRIWIDYNQDGVFSDNDEMVADGLVSAGDSFLGGFEIPTSAPVGNTRMRVSMAFANPFFPVAPESCGVIDFGEVEDYCININEPPIECPLVDSVWFSSITFIAAKMHWNVADGAIAYAYRYRETGTLDYTEFATQDTVVLLENLEPCKTYEAQVLTVCAADTAGYIKNYLLESDCNTSVNEIPEWLSSVNVYPNPTYNDINIKIHTVESGEYKFAVHNMSGFILASAKVHLDANAEGTWTFNESSSLAPGMYVITISHSGYTESRKFIKL